MLYKQFAGTGRKLSAIGFGGMRFKADEYKRDVKISSELVLEAFENGINYFDTAPGYCDDKSEEIMGAAFSQMKYGDFHVSTKCGLWNASDADGARRMVEKSLDRLKVPKITFYLMWCIKNMDEYRRMTAPGGMYEGLLRAKEEGLIEHIGCSTHANGNDVAEIVKDGYVDLVMLGYNAINFAYRRKGIAACHANNIGVVTMNPLGGGIIPQNPEYFSFLVKDTEDSLAVSALKFLVAHDAVTAALPGFSSSEEIRESLLAVTNLPKVDNAYLDEMSKKLSFELNSLCTGCAYCVGCPQEVEVPKLLDAYNHAILAKGEMSRVKNKLRFHWNISAETANKCNGCGQCEGLCTQGLPIIKRLREIGEM
jgi:hypothetical protein